MSNSEGVARAERGLCDGHRSRHIRLDWRAIMLKLVKSNLRKDRAVLTVFLLIIMLCAMLLQTGLFVNRYDRMYDEKKEAYGIGDVVVFAVGDKDTITHTMDGLDCVESYISSDIIRPGETEIICDQAGLEESRDDAVFHSLNSVHIESCSFVSRDDTVSGTRIYTTVHYASANHLNIGDTITLKTEMFGTEDYTLAGVLEELEQGHQYAWHAFYFQDDAFQEMHRQAEQARAEGTSFISQVELVCSYKDGVIVDDGQRTTINALNEAGIGTYSYAVELAKAGYVSVTNILAAFMTVFSLIAMVVCLIMIIFTINNNIDRDVKNIGALRAVGHTTRQVRAALLLEYLVIGFIGAAAGTAIAYILMPVIDRKLMRSVSGMIWEEKFYPAMTSVILAGLLLAMALVVMVSTQKLKNLHPATALRFGLQANTFKKNYLPLATTKGKLSPLLAAKSMLQNRGQSLIVLGIVTVVGFMTIFSGILFYNTRVDISRFQRLVNGDVPDGIVDVSARNEEEFSELRDLVADIPGVSQAYGMSWHNISVQGRETFTFFTDRPEYMECGVYEGTMFREANEAVIGRLLAEKLDVKIGDEILVECSGKKARFIVTGFQQSVVNMGERVFISLEGAKRLGIGSDFTSVRLRLEDPDADSVDRVLAEAKSLLGDKCTGTGNEYRYQRSSDNLTMFATLLLILLLILVNVAIIYLVIKLLLKTIFIRREKEFGIKKAVGFTSRQLRLQLAMSLFPVSLMAAVVGAVLGFYLVNPLISVVLGGFGIASADFLISPILIGFTIIAIVALVFLMTYLMSGRMKKVSAYDLIQE